VPYLSRIFFRPSVGNRIAVRDALIAGVQERRAAGERAGLFERVFPPHGAEFGLVDVWDDLATFDKRRADVRQSPSATMKRMTELGEQPACIEMYETFPPPGGQNPGARYARVGGFRAAPGKGGELRQRLEAFVKEQNTSGVSTGLWAQVIPDRGPTFRTVTGHVDLAAFERSRRDAIGSASVAAFGRDIGPLLYEPSSVELWENLTPQV
jgi:hypothetical protein